ncbi:hypothetical protein BYT27DRAFT_7203157 [Phlegmacium glaucopus]|nr:hypothetical protein BYT27DRAFT_7203157 [Phlegmacium glaucopus]
MASYYKAAERRITLPDWMQGHSVRFFRENCGSHTRIDYMFCFVFICRRDIERSNETAIVEMKCCHRIWN